MSDRNKQLIAYFLLLCLSITLLPLIPLHSHEEDTHRCELNEDIENNLCHVTIYHSDYQDYQCDHDRHFSKTSEDCDFCEYLSSRRQLITFEDYQIILNTPCLELAETQEPSVVVSNSDQRHLGRAPPVS